MRRTPRTAIRTSPTRLQVGLSPDYVHDAFNIFMTTGLDENDRFFYLDPEAKQGDYVDLHAEIELFRLRSLPAPADRPDR